MRLWARPGPALSVALMSLILQATIVVAQPVLASAPRPVLPVENPATGPAQPADDGCLLGSTTASAAGQPTLALNGARQPTAYPEPVVPVDRSRSQQRSVQSPCRTEVSLLLVVDSRNQRKPDGADASLDELFIPSSMLEAGFDVNLPAQSRTITLTNPGEDWALTGLSCGCAGGGAATIARFEPASYPGPVLPISRVIPGSAPCGNSGQAASVLTAPPALKSSPAHTTSAALTGSSSLTSPSSLTSFGGGPVTPDGPLTVYPQPVVPVDRPPAPPPPPRTPGSVSWDQYGTVSIHDVEGAGGSVSCTWTVELVKGRVAIETKTQPPGREGQFTYRATPNFFEPGVGPVVLPGSASPAERSLWKGSWAVELVGLDNAWKVTDSSCSERDVTTPSAAQGQSANLGVDPDDHVRCQFQLKLLSPKPGNWRAKNGRGTVTCKGVNRKIAPTTEVGQIMVLRDGDRLRARGFSGGSTVWTLNRAGEDSLTYTGTVRESVAGASGKFHVRLDLVNEKRMTGVFSGQVRVPQAGRCTVRRPLVITYIGGG